MSTCNRVCGWCLGKFTARTADVKRGWAIYCSKSCKAKAQESRDDSRAAASHWGVGIGITAGELDFEPSTPKDVR
ncbi:MAG: hypothetical protein ACRC2H_01085 [Silanimonas sp.]